MRYNNYHKHTHVSSIFTPDSNEHAEAYIRKEAERGGKNYFTTEHGSMGDIFEAKTLCDKYGIRCLPGLEGYIVPDPLIKDKSNYHIIIIPRTDKARKKVNRISSRANIEGYYYRPRIFPFDLLSLDRDDVYITTACVAGLLKDDFATQSILYPLIEHFRENVFLEVQNHNAEIQKEVNRKAIEIAEKEGLRLIAANDSHYVEPSGKLERAELLKGKHINHGDEDEFILDFPDYDTMFARFQKQGVLNDWQITQAIANTLIFDECEEIGIDKTIKMPNIYPDLTLDERYNLLDKEVNDRFEAIKKEDELTDVEINVRKGGIAHEMKIVEETNNECHTADYFLFNSKLVDLAINKYGGVLTRGGRGSCASFYTNRVMGMTQLDRFTVNLPIFPERFASTARLIENRSMPDIDFNVVSDEPFVKAARELLGEESCYPMIAYGTMQEAEAFRNVCRSKGMEFDEFNEVGKNLDRYRDDKKWKPLIDEAQKYVGTIVSASVHPCAFAISDKSLIDEYGVVRLGDFLCVMVTSGEADEYKILKDDFLKVTVWKLISETFKEIGKPIIPARQLLKEIKNDDRIWKLIADGMTCTLNQIDSDNGRDQAQKYGIKSFEEGAFVAAAIRPSFDSWREGFLSRKHYTTGSKDLDKVLHETGGYILFQESLMRYFEWLSVTPAESIGLIKKISKKKIKQEDFDNLENRIKKKWIENTGSDYMFNETWELIQSCMAYSFCSAHAAATSLDMCYGAYLKVNYPLEYYKVCLDNYADDEVRTKKLINELKYFGIKFETVKFRHSTSNHMYDRETNTIYKGLSSIKYISASIGDELYSLKDNSYDNFTSLLIDITNNTSVNTKQLDILIKSDFFSEFGNVNKLTNINNFFQRLYDKNRQAFKKQIKKDKVDEIGLTDEIIKAFCHKETEKTYMMVDFYSMLCEIEKTVEYADIGTLQKVSNHITYLGSTTIYDDRYKYFACVTNVIDKRTPIVYLYAIANGNTTEVKIPRYKFDKKKLEVGDVIYIKSLKRKKKQAFNPDTGKWQSIPNTVVWWVEDYRMATASDELKPMKGVVQCTDLTEPKLSTMIRTAT